MTEPVARKLIGRSPYLLLIDQPGGSPGWVIVHGNQRRALAIGQDGLREAEEELIDYVSHLNRKPPKGWKPRHFIPEALRRVTIYFISTNEVSDYPIKIGKTNGESVEARLGALQIACPYKLSIIGAVPGAGKTERELHKRFDRARMRGEWFRRTEGLMRFIRQNSGPRLAHVSTEYMQNHSNTLSDFRRLSV